MGAVSGGTAASSAWPVALCRGGTRRGYDVAAWMLDPMTCAGMEIGAPRVAVSALVDLHQLLIERGFRGSSQDDPSIVQEEQNEEPTDTGASAHGPAPAQHSARFRDASW